MRSYPRTASVFVWKESKTENGKTWRYVGSLGCHCDVILYQFIIVFDVALVMQMFTHTVNVRQSNVCTTSTCSNTSIEGSSRLNQQSQLMPTPPLTIRPSGNREKTRQRTSHRTHGSVDKRKATPRIRPTPVAYEAAMPTGAGDALSAEEMSQSQSLTSDWSNPNNW